MFMSMFSHFEISQGKKWSYSLGIGPVTKGGNPKSNTEATSSSVSANSKTVKKDPNSSTPNGSKQDPTRLRLDGLHCSALSTLSPVDVDVDGFNSIQPTQFNS